MARPCCTKGLDIPHYHLGDQDSINFAERKLDNPAPYTTMDGWVHVCCFCNAISDRYLMVKHKYECPYRRDGKWCTTVVNPTGNIVVNPTGNTVVNPTGKLPSAPA